MRRQNRVRQYGDDEITLGKGPQEALDRVRSIQHGAARLPGQLAAQGREAGMVLGEGLGLINRTPSAPQQQAKTQPQGRGFSVDFGAGRDYVLNQIEKAQSKRQGTIGKGKLTDPTQYKKTLEDFLALAEQYMSDSNSEASTALGNQEATLRRNAQDISNQLRGGYGGLSSFIAGQAAPIQSGYQQGIEGVGEAAQRAQTAITEGTAAAQAQQQAILNRLGIADANIPIANNGTTLEAGMAQQIADSAGRAQNAETMLNQNMSSALNFNTSQGTASAVEGQGEQNRIQRDLLSRLAEIADQRTSMQSSSTADKYGLAQDLMNNDYQQWAGNYDRRYGAQRDAMGFAQEQAAAEASANAPREVTSTEASLMGTGGRAEYMLKQNGLDAVSSSYILDGLNRYVETEGNLTLQGLLAKASELAAAGGENANMRILAQKAAMLYAEDLLG